MLLRVSDLVELGYDYEEVVDYGGTKDEVRNNSEWLLRHPSWKQDEDTSSDPSGRLVYYTEAYCRVDQDGDGVRELRRICTVGSAHEVLMNEVVTDTPSFSSAMITNPTLGVVSASTMPSKIFKESNLLYFATSWIRFL